MKYSNKDSDDILMNTSKLSLPIKSLKNFFIALTIVSICLWGIWETFKSMVLTSPESDNPTTWETNQYYEDAIESLSTDLERYPSHVETIILRGSAYCGLKQFHDCLHDYDIALHLAPSDFRLYRFRGRAFAEIGKLPEAGNDFSVWIKENPSDSNGYFERAEVYLKQGRWEEAAADLSVIVELGGNTKVLSGLEGVREALKLEHDGKLSQALEFYRKLKQRSGAYKSYPIIMIRMASLLTRMNQKDLALEILEEIHEINPWDQQVKKLREILLHPRGLPTIDNKELPISG
jgi:tetratricopeptide (TPR) repeat protein